MIHKNLSTFPRIFLALLISGPLFYFTYMKSAFPWAAWISYSGLLYALRTPQWKKSLLLVYGLILGILSIIMVPMVDFLAIGLQILTIVAYSTLKFLPLLGYALLSRKKSHFPASLLFPLFLTLSEWITSLITPFGTWFSIAYSQFPWKFILQFTSITGLWGLIFALGWFNSLLTEFLIQREKKEKASPPMGEKPRKNYTRFHSIAKNMGDLKVALILVILLSGFGIVRLTLPQTPETSIRVMSIVGNTSSYIDTPDLVEIMDGYCPVYSPDVLVTNEYCLSNPNTTIASILDPLANRCLTYNVAMCAAGVEVEDEGWTNRLWWFQSTGDEVAVYDKHYLIPGIETMEYFGRQPSVPPMISVNSVQLSSIICFDGAFTSYVNRQVPKNVDLVFQPSFDWESIDPTHSQLATFRAVENGFALLKPTHQGYTIACDAFGREILPTEESIHPDFTVSIYDIPIYRNFSLYRYGWEYFVIVNLLGLVYLLFDKRNSKG